MVTKAILLLLLAVTLVISPLLVAVLLGLVMLVASIPLALWLIDPHRDEITWREFFRVVRNGEVVGIVLSSIEDLLFMPANIEDRDPSMQVSTRPEQPQKLTGEVLEFVERELASNPELEPADLTGVLDEQFGIFVRGPTLERVLYRERRKRGG